MRTLVISGLTPELILNSNSRSCVFVRPRERVRKCVEEKGLTNHCKRVLVYERDVC